MLRLLTLAAATLFAVPVAAQVTGHIAKDGSDNYLFVPDKPGTYAQPLNADPVTAEALSRLPSVAIPEASLDNASELLSKSPGAAKLPSVARYLDNQKILTGSRYEALRAEMVKLERAVDRTLQPGAMSPGVNDVASIRKQAVATAAAVSQTFQATLSAPEVTTEQIDVLQEIVDALEAELAQLEPPSSQDRGNLSAIEKAIFSGGREYSPYVYRRIASNTQGAVGVGSKLSAGAGNANVFCSGALIGPDLVLTARHCLFRKRHGVVSQRHKSSLRVVFDFEDDPAIAFQRQEATVAEIIALGPTDGDPADHLDYAILKINTPPPPSIVWMLTSDAAPGSKRQLCLSTVNLSRDEEIYVVGHPEARQRTVADNGKVLFPYLVEEEVLGILSAKVRREMLQRAKDETADADQIKKDLLDWNKSYRKRDDGIYVHHSQSFGGQPTLGIQSNTYSGNSGGPVFSKLYNQVVGVFRGGEFDFKTEMQAGWQFHESALPIELMIHDMNSRVAGWLEKHKVCAWGKDDDPFQLWSDDDDLRKHCQSVCV